MNRNLKLAVTAAIAAMGMVSQAHALTSATISTSGSLFLYAFEDRQANTTATNSAIFDLGLASNFDTGANQTLDLSTLGGGNTAWATYIATIANPANIHWGVFGTSVGVGMAGTKMLTTLSSVPVSINGTALNTAVTKSNTVMGVYGATGGFNAVTTNDLASGTWDDTAGVTTTYVMTAGLDQSMSFFQYTSTGTKSSSLATKLAFATGGDADTFTLSNAGVLTYTATAPVPEADTYAMMLAGLGLVGFMVRRRKAA